MSGPSLAPVVITGKRQPPSDDLTLVIDGHALGGWTEVRVTRGIERLPSDFELHMTERFPGEVNALQVKPGQECQIMIGADLVLTGYVDRVIPSFSGRQHEITVLGRSKCADLVDCAAYWPNGQILGSSVLDVAQKLAEPYNIAVTCATDPGKPIPQFNMMWGETPFEIIERLCRFRQFLAYDQPDGNLLLSRVSQDLAASGFQQGVNVQHAVAMWSQDQRYSDYWAFLNSVDTYQDVGNGGNLLGIFNDQGVGRFRLRAIIAEANGGFGQDIAKDRAQWEAVRRFGRSAEVRLTTDAWRDAAGMLYEPNTLASVDLPTLKIADKLWTISQVTYLKGPGGTTCDVIMMPPEAFTVAPGVPLVAIPAEVANLPPNLGRP